MSSSECPKTLNYRSRQYLIRSTSSIFPETHSRACVHIGYFFVDFCVLHMFCFYLCTFTALVCAIINKPCAVYYCAVHRCSLNTTYLTCFRWLWECKSSHLQCLASYVKLMLSVQNDSNSQSAISSVVKLNTIFLNPDFSSTRNKN